MSWKTVVLSAVAGSLACLAGLPAQEIGDFLAEPKREERKTDDAIRALLEARNYFNTGELLLATTRLETLLRDHPDAVCAAEVAYKLATCHLLHGQSAQAKKLYERIVRAYPDSPWAGLVLEVHCDDKQVLTLADEKRKEARKTGKVLEARRAIPIYKMYLNRFSKDHGEIFFKVAECLRLTGEMENCRQTLAQLREHDKEGKWGKLAGFLLGDAKFFRENMDELFFMGGEADEVFHHLASKHMAALEGEDQVKCLYYQAHCVDELGERDASVNIHLKIVEQHPTSSWAGDSAFWLAEYRFNDKDYKGAHDAYLKMAEKYRQHPRAGQARMWAAWIEQRDETWQEIDEAAKALVGRLDKLEQGLALTLNAVGESHSFQARLAMAGYEKFLFRIVSRSCDVLLASNEEGSWYYSHTGGVCLRAAEKLSLPRPKVRATEEGAFTMNCNLVSSESHKDAGPAVEVPVSVVLRLLAEQHSKYHVCKETKDGGKQVIIRCQAPCRGRPEPDSLEIALDEKRQVQKIECSWRGSGGSRGTVTISDLVMAEPPPAEAFAVSLPDQVRMSEVAAINPLTVVGDLFKYFAVISEEMK